MKKQSFFDRLTNSIKPEEEYDDYFDDVRPIDAPPPPRHSSNFEEEAPAPREEIGEGSLQELQEEGELAVDVYETGDAVVVKALVAGVPPSNLDIAVTRDMVTIEGTREDEREVQEDNYYRRELYWGGFTRTILLPAEVDPEAAEATERHGILIVRLPKINKSKQTKIKVRSK